MSNASVFIHVCRWAAIFLTRPGFWEAKWCIKLDLPVPFAPRTNSVCPAANWSCGFGKSCEENVRSKDTDISWYNAHQHNIAWLTHFWRPDVVIRMPQTTLNIKNNFWILHNRAPQIALNVANGFYHTTTKDHSPPRQATRGGRSHRDLPLTRR